MLSNQITSQQVISHEELLARINRAKVEKARLLHLGGKSLSDLPDEIGQLVYLEWLILQNNFLRQFPEEIASLSSLRVLLLGRNGLANLSEGIAKLVRGAKRGITGEKSALNPGFAPRRSIRSFFLL